VLAQVDLEIPAGTVTTLIGPNGSGKSTLLHAIAGLLRPRRGSLDVAARQRPGGVALVLQATEANAQLPLTVREVVAMGRYPHHRLWSRFRQPDRAAVASALELLDLGDLASAQLRELSGGQRQRAFVAQGLAQEAELLMLDEPFTGLDLVSQARIREVIDHVRVSGRTVIFSTHDLADASVADQLLLMGDRRIIAAGPPEAVLTDEHLLAAYGSRLVKLGDQVALLDDPHDHSSQDANQPGPTTS
jgi:ABC-type Mn2+/Zn2+ transport system ATPase subunit